MQNTFAAQLRGLITHYEDFLSESEDPYGFDVISDTQIMTLHTRCITVVERASGLNSTYSKEVRRISAEVRSTRNVMYRNVAKEIGVVKALLYDINSGSIKNIEEIIHGDLFSDFLEMASHLVEQKYKDPAAVMAGSTLEVHLRKLCDKNDIDTVKRDGKPKKADTLNAELAQADVYEKLDHKSVTAWLDLRNKAAHGEYSEYDEGQVRLLIDGVRDFITRHSA